MGAISTLRLKDNKLATKEAGKALAAALAGNSVLTELDVSSNNWFINDGDKGDGAGFAQELAAGIKDNGALSFLDISNNKICAKIQGPKKVDIKTSEGDIVEFNGAQGILVTWNDTYFGFVPLSGIQAIATAIKDMANLLGNYIPVEQAQELVKIMQAKEKLTTLCGLSKEETELDFSDQNLGAGDAVLIANDISDMGAISSFTLSGGRYHDICDWKEAPAVTMETSMTEADLSGKHLGVGGAIMLSAFLPKCM
jgi:hypothetical protein